jgi:acetyl-CoA carboxylase biotin carboxyl carrier protein
MTEELQPVGPGTVPAVDPEAATPPAAPTTDTARSATTDDRDGDGDATLLALIDRLSGLLDRSDLTELEVESGGTGLTLRKPSALVGPVVGAAPAASSASPAAVPDGDAGSVGGEATTPERPSVKAPLTGIFYASPAPGSAPYVQIGGEVAVGQVIGLIEAMKLFNEIKSDLAGRVAKVVPETGTLVKAKQPLIEVEPL